jgi:hypothetical protein
MTSMPLFNDPFKLVRALASAVVFSIGDLGVQTLLMRSFTSNASQNRKMAQM